MINSYKDLIVWQKSMELVVCVYGLTEQYPKSEIYSLASQTKRSAVSIPSNIAEGRRRGSRKDFHHFIVIAYGSGTELETQIEIAKRLPFGKNLNFTTVDGLLNEIMKMLNKLLSSLRACLITSDLAKMSEFRLQTFQKAHRCSGIASAFFKVFAQNSEHFISKASFSTGSKKLKS